MTLLLAWAPGSNSFLVVRMSGKNHSYLLFSLLHSYNVAGGDSNLHRSHINSHMSSKPIFKLDEQQAHHQMATHKLKHSPIGFSVEIHSDYTCIVELPEVEQIQALHCNFGGLRNILTITGMLLNLYCRCRGQHAEPGSASCYYWLHKVGHKGSVCEKRWKLQLARTSARALPARGFKFQWTKPPKENPASAHTARAPAPPLPSGRGLGLVYGRRKNESGPTGLGMDSPERATRCRCWAHEMDCARMGGCDPVRLGGRGEGHIVQWWASFRS